MRLIIFMYQGESAMRYLAGYDLGGLVLIGNTLLEAVVTAVGSRTAFCVIGCGFDYLYYTRDKPLCDVSGCYYH